MRTGLFILIAFCMAGCAEFGGPKPAGEPERLPSREEKVAPAVSAAPITPVPTASAVAKDDPRRIDFGAMTVVLDEAAKRKVAALLPQARSANFISIRGYCDRNKIGNAQQAAIARAKSVKDELVRAGIPANKIRVHYTTDKPDLDSAIVSFNSVE